MKNYPLKLTPVTKSIIWGGKKIPELFGIGEKGSSVAEAWMLACRGDGMNIIENGEYAGRTLEEYMKASGMEGNFPLLVKIIDAADKLSVQVHPDDEYAHAHGIDQGKTEMWYILDAEPGAKLVYGVKEGVTASQVADAAKEGSCEEDLTYVPVKKGDCFFIPAGLVHAIGEGILIAEIQQNSNTTYRLYDYERRDKDGNKRELHIESARETIKTKFESGKAIVNNVVIDDEDMKLTILCSCEFFSASKCNLAPGKRNELFCGNGIIHFLCTEGNGFIEYDGERYPIKKGDSYLLPASLSGKCVLEAAEGLEVIASY